MNKNVKQYVINSKITWTLGELEGKIKTFAVSFFTGISLMLVTMVQAGAVPFTRLKSVTAGGVARRPCVPLKATFLLLA